MFRCKRTILHPGSLRRRCWGGVMPAAAHEISAAPCWCVHKLRDWVNVVAPHTGTIHDRPARPPKHSSAPDESRGVGTSPERHG
jgi:hypothetical protein